MTIKTEFQSVRAGLFQPERGLYVVPIRHHSPACARQLRHLLAEIQPRHVLIEAPADFADHIPLLLDRNTKPPVALVALVDPGDERPRLAGYYPFCAHSPEFVALQDGDTLGANLKFIDAPSTEKAMCAPLEQAEPVAFLEERHFDSSDYTKKLAQEAGCRDGFELWDHLFEAQIGTADWRSFFGEVGVYCAGIRSATSEAEIVANGDANREAHMGRAVKAALADGGPVVAVVGGFHAPALIGDLTRSPDVVRKAKTSESYLIRYGYRALDALNGYAAGLPQPGYYQHLWERAEKGNPAWREVAISLLSEFSEKARQDGHVISLPSQVEAIRMAEVLASMRGRPGALRHDLIDGIHSAMVKGESSSSDPILSAFKSYLCGDALGDVPAGAGVPPLVADARRRAERLRFDVSDTSPRRRKLDIRRKETHLEASRFCHAMTLIGSPFAGREVGPDFISGSRTELLFEEWSYTWSPLVEGHLIESAVLGDDLPSACLSHLARARDRMIDEGNARDLPGMVTLLSRGLLAGLGEELGPFLNQLGSDIQNVGTFSTVTATLRKLMFLQRSTGPLKAPETLNIFAAVEAAYGRLIYLCDELPRTNEEQVKERLDAILTIAEIMRDCAEAGVDGELLKEALDRVVDEVSSPVILGALLAVCLQTGLRKGEVLIEAVEGRLSGVSLDLPGRIGVLRGILYTAPMLLWHTEGLLRVVDTFLCGLSEGDFLELLPHLRLAFTSLNPRDTDRLAEELSVMHGVQKGALISRQINATEADLTRALNVERRVVEMLEADGLCHWSKGARG